mmetsp:Transcript_25874/g.86085  ORF Transcript_25874/g.86085 Transcript_25874/m.86085 type:complete len:202 (+) Transcript_25874:728-1333(+)
MRLAVAEEADEVEASVAAYRAPVPGDFELEVLLAAGPHRRGGGRGGPREAVHDVAAGEDDAVGGFAQHHKLRTRGVALGDLQDQRALRNDDGLESVAHAEGRRMDDVELDGMEAATSRPARHVRDDVKIPGAPLCEHRAREPKVLEVGPEFEVVGHIDAFQTPTEGPAPGKVARHRRLGLAVGEFGVDLLVVRFHTHLGGL